MNERLALIGATGSGKSEMARYLLARGGDRQLIFDFKGEGEFDALPGFRHARHLPLLGKTWRIIYTPGVNDDAATAKLILDCYRRGNCRIYADELATLVEEYPHSTAAMHKAVRQGRSRYVSIWTASQRPRHVPLIFYSETEVWLEFTLREPNDRKRARGAMGPAADRLLPMYHFLYIRPGMEEPIEIMLDLPSQTLQEVGSNGHEAAQ